MPPLPSRSPLYAPNGAVATSQPLAASAGLSVLRNGGNAVDAAIATAAALTVVEPAANSIGGDLFAIVWDGQRLHGLNGSGRSPAALNLDLARDAAVQASDAAGGAQADEASLPASGWLPVTVPGAPAGWRDLHDRLGSAPFASLFTDAIGYAEGGFPVSSEIAREWDAGVRRWAGLRDGAGPLFDEWRSVFAVDGRAPRAGERWANPAAGRALALIASSGAEAVYHGEIAHALAAHAAGTGGLITAADLEAHASTWVEPICVNYRGFDVWELPPNGQGVAALMALQILDGLDLASASGERRVHALIEATKLALTDAQAHVTDPETADVPVAAMLSPEYASARRALIGERAIVPEPGPQLRGGTVYLATADANGMMVSLIQSTYLGFGSHVVLPGFGFPLQNRGLGFSLDPAHPNVVAGAKRPYHTIIPGFLTRDGAAIGPFGVMGGHMQPQGHVQLIHATIDGGLNPQAALSQPRWYWHAGREIAVESSMDPEIVAALGGRGHDVTIEDSSTYGRGQAIWRLPDGAGYVAGSEPRCDGAALGY